MRQDSYKPVVIFSVSRHDKTPEVNKRNTHKVMSVLFAMGVEFFQVNGSFEGILEDCFMVLSQQEDVVANICRDYAQESYLHLNAYRVATLVTVGATESADTRDVIGTFVSVSIEEALSHDSWTERGGFYYIVKD